MSYGWDLHFIRVAGLTNDNVSLVEFMYLIYMHAR